MKHSSVWAAFIILTIMFAGVLFVGLQKSPKGTDRESEDSAATTPLVGVSEKESQASDLGPKPTCSVTTDKKLYALGDVATYSWKSENTTTVSFNNHFKGPYGSGYGQLPEKAFAPSGSTPMQAATTGYTVVQMIATGPGGTGTCEAAYYVGGSGGVVSATPIVSFGSLPARIPYTSVAQRSTSSDGSLAFTLESYAGTDLDGHAVIIVKDGSVEFPVNLTYGKSQNVLLYRGAIEMRFDVGGGNMFLSIK